MNKLMQTDLTRKYECSRCEDTGVMAGGKPCTCKRGKQNKRERE